jgi:hypothetical protein
MFQRSVLGVLAAIAVLGLAACGGGGDNKKATGKPQADGTYKKADLAAAANTICFKTKQAARQVAPLADPNDPAKLAAYLGALLPLQQKQASDLQALKPAPDVASDWNAMLAKEKEILQFFQNILTKAKKKDKSASKDLAQGQKLGPEFAVLAKKVGANVCAT